MDGRHPGRTLRALVVAVLACACALSAAAWAPCPSGPPQTTPVPPGEWPVSADAVYLSVSEANGWQRYVYAFGRKNTGRQRLSFDVTPLADGVDASVSFADHDVPVRGFDSLAMMVRFSTGGVIGVRNGGSFETDQPYPYSGGCTYHVEIVASMNAKTYDVYITGPDGARTLAAQGYRFRNSAAVYTNDVGKMFVISADADGLLRVENVTLSPIR